MHFMNGFEEYLRTWEMNFTMRGILLEVQWNENLNEVESTKTWIASATATFSTIYIASAVATSQSWATSQNYLIYSSVG